MAEAAETRRTPRPGWHRARDREAAADGLPGIAAVRYDDALAAGQEAYRRGRTEEALRHLATAAVLAERRALPHLLAAEILAETGRLPQAILAYSAALERDPQDERAAAGYRWAASRGRRRASASGSPPARPGIRLSAGAALLTLVPYLVAIAAAEYAVTYLNPMLVFPLHGGIIAAAAGHAAILEHRAGRGPADRYLAALLLTLMLSPLIRVISLTLPLGQLPDPYQYLFAGIPMLVGALMVARYVGFRPRWIGLAWRGTQWQLLAIVGSVSIGLIEYVILRPEPLGAFPWTAAGWLPALSVALATGFPEELIFRGLMQTALRPLIGTGWNVLYVSAVFAVLHVGYQSGIDVVFVFAASLFYGWIFERSRSIIGVSIGHGLANAILFFVAPNLF